MECRLSILHPYKDTSTQMTMCVQCMSMCVSHSVSAWVCCYHKRNLFTHVCVHKEVPFVFHQALQTLHHHRERHLSVDPAHMLCNTANLFSKRRHDGVCVRACVCAYPLCFYTYMSEKREYM